MAPRAGAENFCGELAGGQVENFSEWHIITGNKSDLASRRLPGPNEISVGDNWLGR